MRLFHIVFAAASLARSAVANIVDHFVAALAALMPSASAGFASGGYSMTPPAPGQSLDRALLSSLKHESAVSRRAAARHV